jgi:hypothetical protein
MQTSEIQKPELGYFLSKGWHEKFVLWVVGRYGVEKMYELDREYDKDRGKDWSSKFDRLLGEDAARVWDTYRRIAGIT